MDSNEVINKNNNNKVKITIITLLLVIVGLCTAIILDFTGVNELGKFECINEEVIFNCEGSSNVNAHDLEKELQKRYEELYYIVEEGSGLELYTSDLKSLLDYSKLNKVFTKDAIVKIEKKYTDYCDDKLCISNNFMGTIFGITDEDLRTLHLIYASSDTALLKAEHSDGFCFESNGDQLCYPDYGGEYIVFKKVDNTWLIDMFE